MLVYYRYIPMNGTDDENWDKWLMMDDHSSYTRNNVLSPCHFYPFRVPLAPLFPMLSCSPPPFLYVLTSLSDLESIWDPCHDSVHQVYLFLTYFRINTRSCSFISIAHYVSYGVTMAILFHISYFHVLKIFFRCWKNFSIPSLQVATSNFRSNFTRRVLKLSSKSESERMRKEYFFAN